MERLRLSPALGCISDSTADPSTPEGVRLARSQNVSPASSLPPSSRPFCFYLPGWGSTAPGARALELAVLPARFCATLRPLPFAVPCGRPNFGPGVCLCFSSQFFYLAVFQKSPWGLVAKMRSENGTVVRDGVNPEVLPWAKVDLRNGDAKATPDIFILICDLPCSSANQLERRRWNVRPGEKWGRRFRSLALLCYLLPSDFILKVNGPLKVVGWNLFTGDSKEKEMFAFGVVEFLHAPAVMCPWIVITAVGLWSLFDNSRKSYCAPFSCQFCCISNGGGSDSKLIK